MMALSAELKERLSAQVRQRNVFQTILSDDYRQYLNRVEIRESWIDTQEGKTHVYIIRAKSCTRHCPVYVNIHGGGFVRPHSERNIIFCAKMAHMIDGVAIDLDYRLAPEYPYPAAFNEAYDTVKWVFDHADELKIDPARVIVGGDSAGGNLTVGVTMKAQQTGDFRILLQMLYYPAIDMVTPPEDKPEAETSMIDPERMRAFNQLYLNGDEEAARSPFVSMAFAPLDMLRGLPDMLLITAGLDNLRFEAEAFAHRLAEAGVKVTHRRFEKSHHSFIMNCLDEWEEAQALIAMTMLRVTRKMTDD